MTFIEKKVLHGGTGQLDTELDTVRSEYPLVATNSGYYATVGEAGSAKLLLSVPSQTRFKPRTLFMDNATIANIMRFYTGGSGASCSATFLCFHIGASQTEVVNMDGVTIDKDLWISHLYSNITVRVGGLLIASGPL